MFFVGDIHANKERLEAAMSLAEGDQILFIGDLIDNGPNNEEVCRFVFDQIEAGFARCLMGNHELNAILYHTKGISYGDFQDGHMRSHKPSKIKQHSAFLREFEGRDRDIQGMVERFLSLPLLIEEEEFRAVHACWHQPSVDAVLARRPDARLKREDLQEVALEETEFAKAVVTLLKGPEMDLPAGSSYFDLYGTERRTSRMKWWEDGAMTYKDMALSVPAGAVIPDTPLPDHLKAIGSYPKDKKIFFGHYKMVDLPDPADLVVCLDTPKEIFGVRFDGKRCDLIRQAAPELPSP